jgi:hypothetical protein
MSSITRVFIPSSDSICNLAITTIRWALSAETIRVSVRVLRAFYMHNEPPG